MSHRQLFIAKALWLMFVISLVWCVVVIIMFPAIPYTEIDVLDVIGEASTVVMAGFFATFIARSNHHESTKIRLVAAMLCLFVGGSADFMDEFFVVRYWPALLENGFKTAAALFTLLGLLSLVREAKSSERRAEHFRKVSSHLSLLTTIGQTISRKRNLNDILDVVYSNIAKLANVEVFRVILLRNGQPVSQMTRQLPGRAGMDESAIQVLNILEQQVLEQGNSLYLFDLTRCAEQYVDPEQHQSLVNLLVQTKQLNSSSLFIVPLQLEGEVIGVISLFMSRIQGLDSEQCQCIESIASYSAVAINNALCSEELDKRTGLLAG